MIIDEITETIKGVEHIGGFAAELYAVALI